MRLARYLATHTLHRWREQPWSPLGRMAVALLISTGTLSVMGGFDSAEALLLSRMEKSGANVVSVFSPLSPGVTPNAATRYEWLSQKGEVLSVVRLFRSAEDDMGRRLALYAYSNEAIPALRGLDDEQGCMIVGGELPAGLISTVTFGDMSFRAKNTGGGLASKLPADGAEVVALVPAEMVGQVISSEGGSEVTVFENRSDTAVSAITATLDRFHAAERTRASVVSAGSLMDQIAELRQKKAVAMGLLAAGSVALIALVFGAIAALEYRESRFVFALLRSMGATGGSLYAQALAEALCVAFVGGALAVASLPLVASKVLAHLALADAAPGLGSAFISGGSLAVLTAALFLGGLFASFPAAVGLRTPFGRILD